MSDDEEPDYHTIIYLKYKGRPFGKAIIHKDFLDIYAPNNAAYGRLLSKAIQVHKKSPIKSRLCIHDSDHEAILLKHNFKKVMEINDQENLYMKV